MKSTPNKNQEKMKALKLFVVGLLLFFAGSAHAQISVNVNIGNPPQWGPAGYTDVRYYYLPDVEAYYDVPSSMFIYFNGVSWVHRKYLPSRFRNYDLYNGYKVVMTDYRGNTPYSHFSEHKTKYAKGYRGPAQKTYGERPAKGYSHSKNYSHEYKKEKQQENHNSLEKGHGKGNGNKK
jgi:hypothetical protein